MRLNYNKDEKVLEVDDFNLVKLTPNRAYPHPVLVDTMNYRNVNVDGKRLQISQKILDEHFEPVEDFYYLEFSKSLKEFIGYYQVYKSKEADYFISLDKDLQEDWEGDEMYEENKYKIDRVYYRTEESNSVSKCIEELNKFIEIDNDSSKKISVVLKTASGFKFKEHKIKPLELNIDTMYNDDFRPVHEHIVDRLTNTNKGVVMLHGDAGTGKSNYIKYLTTAIPQKRFVFIPVNVIRYLTDPSFLGELIDNKGSVLVLEDCENYITDRNLTKDSVVSTILNLSDGILSDVLGVQIICTFNTNLSNIDSALLRKGRLIDEYKFERLSSEKTQALAKTLGLDLGGNMTLAEVFNEKDKSHRSQKGKSKIGFR